MAYKDKPIVTAKKILDYNNRINTVPESFIITSRNSVIDLLRFYSLKRTSNTTWGQVFTLTHDNINIGLVYFRSCGAPELAMTIEELVALGAKRFIFVGSAGALQSHLKAGSTILPTKAIIEEGTSRHYAKPSKYSTANISLSNLAERLLKENSISYSKGTVWTTDALYRETKEKVKKYRKEGALCVEMETSALFTVSAYCKTEAAALLYITDSLSGLEWQPYFKSEAVDQSRALLLKTAIDTLCSIKNPSFKVKPLKKSIKGAVLVNLIMLSRKIKEAIT